MCEKLYGFVVWVLFISSWVLSGQHEKFNTINLEGQIL